MYERYTCFKFETLPSLKLIPEPKHKKSESFFLGFMEFTTLPRHIGKSNSYGRLLYSDLYPAYIRGKVPKGPD